MANYLITGYWGQPHVTSENDRGINAGIIGAGRYVLPVGEQFKADYIGNNTIRLYDGKLVDNGAAAGIPAGEYIDLYVPNAKDGMKRNDIIAFQYSQDISTLIESGQFVVIQGEETSGTAADPEMVQADLLSNRATLDQMALWRVSIAGSVIAAPVPLFSVSKSLSDVSTSGGGNSSGGSSSDVTLPEIWPIDRGGTGANTAAQALANLGAAAKTHAHELSEINGLQTLLASVPKMDCGSYHGEGDKQFGGSSKTLEFSFVPKLVVVTSNNENNKTLLVLISGATYAPCFVEGDSQIVNVEWDGNSVTWSSSGGGYYAANSEYSDYNYIAFG